jgi:hypothetical protein
MDKRPREQNSHFPSGEIQSPHRYKEEEPHMSPDDGDRVHMVDEHSSLERHPYLPRRLGLPPPWQDLRVELLRRINFFLVPPLFQDPLPTR